jgi:hypothetical protein
MIPEEERGPAWLRDYGYTDFSQIEADIQAMEKFAAKLSDDVRTNYAPHLSTVTSTMSKRLPPPPAEFSELSSFLTVHNEAQNVTHANVYNYANGTDGFARAAADISKKYSGSDAFSHAKVTDVNKAFDEVGIPDTAGTPVNETTGDA